VLEALRSRFLLFFSGRERSASEVLSGTRMSTLERIEQLARETCDALEAGDLPRCASLMNESWEAKRDRAPGTVTPEMDQLRVLARRSAGGGVLSLGAGGGGFLLVLSDDPGRTRRAMAEAGAPELTFGLDAAGCVPLVAPG
jgi:D-glycero-alpha-D-manno-heptose-7-phosphate kinase